MSRLKGQATEMNLSYGFIQYIVHDKLGFHSVCTTWVPQKLMSDMKQN